MTRLPLLAPRLAILSTTIVLVMVVTLAQPAAAGDTICTGTLGAGTHDNIRVPDGATCTLNGTRAQGNVFVGTGARLTAGNVTVIGNIQAEGAASVAVTNASIGGSIQHKQGGAATVTGTRINADLQFESNNAALRAEGNTVGGNLQAEQNGGGLHIANNTIDGNLQCQANDPAPTGGGNIVRGSAEDQCARLTGSGGAGGGGGTGRQRGRLAGPDRFHTAVEISKAAFPSGAGTVYLARADLPADALAGGVLTNGPILLVPSCGQLPTVVAAEIRRLGPARVIALGGSAAVCDAVLEAAARA